jgi:hypothetical protein
MKTDGIGWKWMREGDNFAGLSFDSIPGRIVQKEVGHPYDMDRAQE